MPERLAAMIPPEMQQHWEALREQRTWAANHWDGRLLDEWSPHRVSYVAQPKESYVLSQTSGEDLDNRLRHIEARMNRMDDTNRELRAQLRIYDEINKELVEQVVELQAKVNSMDERDTVAGPYGRLPIITDD